MALHTHSYCCVPLFSLHSTPLFLSFKQNIILHLFQCICFTQFLPHLTLSSYLPFSYLYPACCHLLIIFPFSSPPTPTLYFAVIHIYMSCLLSLPPPTLFDLQNDGETPLIWATRKGHTEVVKVLIVKGANMNQANVRHRTTIVTAALFLPFLTTTSTPLPSPSFRNPFRIMARPLSTGLLKRVIPKWLRRWWRKGQM